MKKILTVDGMMCAHCQMHVQKALAAVDGVQEAAVDLEKKQATVTLTKEVPDQVLMELKAPGAIPLWMAAVGNKPALTAEKKGRANIPGGVFALPFKNNAAA